jgi:hypothetical protein
MYQLISGPDEARVRGRFQFWLQRAPRHVNDLVQIGGGGLFFQPWPDRIHDLLPV